MSSFDTESPAVPSRTAADARDLMRWQVRLLPLMKWMVVGLASFFFITSLAQLVYLHWEIARAPEADLRPAQSSLGRVPESPSEDQRLAAFRAQSAVLLELHAMQRRYHQANVLLMSRIWIRYLGFVTGMMLALVGAVFILGKLEVPTSTVRGEVSNQLKYEIQSSSPGIILGVLGTVLMAASIVVNHRIEVQDKPVYLREALPVSDTAGRVPDSKPVLQRPDANAAGGTR